MNGGRLNTYFRKACGEFFHHAFCVAKNHGPFGRKTFYQLFKCGILILKPGFYVKLSNRAGDFVVYFDNDGCAHIVFGYFFNAVGHCCAEHCGNAVIGAFGNYLFDFFLKTHFQHFVGFVQHEHFQVFELERAAL